MASLSLDEQRAKWPGVSNLRPRELAVHAAWRALNATQRNFELGKVPGWSRPPPPFTFAEQCRDLVLSRRALPNASTRNLPPPLTEVELTALLTPTPAATDVWSALGISQSDFAAMRQTISSQQAEIDMLRGGASDGVDATSSYEVGFSSLALLPGEGKGSWSELLVLPKRDRQKLLRLHTGTFDDFPKDLELTSVWGDYAAIKNLKLTFSEFVKQDVNRALMMNKGTLKSILTVHSKLEELNTELLGISIPNADTGVVDEAAVVSAHDVRAKVALLQDNVTGAVSLALDAHAGLCLSVSNKVMNAMGAKHLQKTSADKETDDFISAKATENIMDRAELKEGVRIATNASKGIFGTPSQKSAGTGKRSGGRLSTGFNTPTKRGGAPKGGGKGGKGKGGGAPKGKRDKVKDKDSSGSSSSTGG
jgi:hypothetical protein